MTLMFLNGGAMRGGPLNHLLGDAPFVGAVRTAPKYRFYSVGDVFPAIEPVDEGGVSVAGELYDVPWSVLERSLLPAEPPELELGVIELEDGSGTLSMVRRRAYAEPDTYRDISAHADWRAYQATVRRPFSEPNSVALHRRLTDIEPDVAHCIAEAGPLLEQAGEHIARARLIAPLPTGGHR